jgi:hypothetical protein
VVAFGDACLGGLLGMDIAIILSAEGSTCADAWSGNSTGGGLANAWDEGDKGTGTFGPDGRSKAPCPRITMRENRR